MQEKPINMKRAYSEYSVTEPTTDFAIGFEYYEERDNVLVQLNGVAIGSLGYTVTLINRQTIRVDPAVTEGIIRIQRETDVDENLYKFTAGAPFEARTMDENFEQIRNAMQEIRDGFSYYSSRWLIEDSVLEMQGSTSFAEPALIFGQYIAARDFTIMRQFPNIAWSDAIGFCGIDILRNDVPVIQITFDGIGGHNITFLGEGDVQEVEYKRGDVLKMVITDFHYTMRSVSVTLIGKFPVFEVPTA